MYQDWDRAVNHPNKTLSNSNRTANLPFINKWEVLFYSNSSEMHYLIIWKELLVCLLSIRTYKKLLGEH